MKKFFLTICATFICGLGVWAQSATDDSHFISDAEFRQKVETAFQEKMQLVGSQFFDLQGQKLTSKELEALHFLYAYMPLADITDYQTAYHLANVRAAFEAQTQMAWGEKVPASTRQQRSARRGPTRVL